MSHYRASLAGANVSLLLGDVLWMSHYRASLAVANVSLLLGDVLWMSHYRASLALANVSLLLGDVLWMSHYRASLAVANGRLKATFLPCTVHVDMFMACVSSPIGQFYLSPSSYRMKMRRHRVFLLCTVGLCVISFLHYYKALHYVSLLKELSAPYPNIKSFIMVTGFFWREGGATPLTSAASSSDFAASQEEGPPPALRCV
ncbi:unnamed protein product [Oncorhynchus mykiss]|uniref:Uncharacterized protein n=1 Tax=Oncorhynchus mykiss TaxID=8022 RepID=A0A060YKJ9_ONCMY|nr:unnamed protein product [Oncorhynchus mykiss]